MRDYTAKYIARFWSRVAKSSDDTCWLWQLTPRKDGYGRMRVFGVEVVAHRIAYELANGAIPDGLWVLHKCDNRRCCNPSHLFLGTLHDNVQDMVSKNRQATGERNARHTLSSFDVFSIRHQYAQGVKQAAIARQFGTSRQQIHRIVRYKERKLA